MNPSSWFGADGDGNFRVSWEDGERVFCRQQIHVNGRPVAVLAVLPAVENPTPATLDRLAREYSLRDELDGAWAVRPLEFVAESGRTIMVLEDPGGEPLEGFVGAPLEIGRFLHLAIGIATAVGKVHQRNLTHKNLKPANILVNCADGQVRLTGFGIASRLPRERQAPDPPDTIAGTLPYMAPEQTGRMNRSIDSRSDLYALGVIFYQMLTGTLPFNAIDPMEWVHCHIARQPAPLSERTNIPAPIPAIITKLLAKTAEERYQTAAGVSRDLHRCLTEWRARGYIDDFVVGQQDTPGRLLIPEKLYGRTREVETLLASFDRVVKSGAVELVLVCGYSGIGKSSVVNELHKVLVPPRGLFASGKFDQYKRDIPYSTLAQPLQSLIRSLLGKSDNELNRWRNAFVEALGLNGRLMVDIVPELAFIVGEQPPVGELPPKDAQRRFQLVLRRFIGVFARPEHPLLLFLDDLQWIDAATLDLLDDLLTRSDLQHLMLVGAYRDNEVNSSHPLARKLDTIKKAGAKVKEVALAPLVRDHLVQLIADTIRCEPERAAPLAELVQQKTDGNPFFVIQFISALADEALLTFDHSNGEWSWDLGRIHAKAYTDNVVDFMVAKLARLSAETQRALQLLACLGNVTEISILSIVFEISQKRVEAVLWEAVRQELIERLDGSCRFSHDRVQETAYSLIPEALRNADHLRIGRLLAARTPPGKLEETIFEIVYQLNRGVTLITEGAEREQLAEFNLIAGKRAKASTAYADALTYLVAGATLLTEDCWERRHALTFALEFNRAECEFLTGELPAAEQRLNALLSRAATTVERATVVCLCLDLYTARGENARAIAVALDFLQPLGIDLPRHPTEEDVRREYEHICSQLHGLSVEDWLAFPLMVDPSLLAMIDVLMKIQPPAHFAEPNLWCLSIIRILQFSLEQGNSDASIAAYVALGLIAAQRRDYQLAFRFGEISYQVTERLPKTRFRAAVYMNFGANLVPCVRHVREGRDLLRRAFEIAKTNGDLIFAGYSCAKLIENLLAGGESLAEAQREAEHVLEFVRKSRFGYATDWIAAQLGLIRTLRGSTPRFGCLDDEQFDEQRTEGRFLVDQQEMRTQSRYWVCKLEARFFAGNYADALEASERMHEFLGSLPYLPQASEYHFYSALSHAASCQSGMAEERGQHVEALVAHHRQLQAYAVNCPENFAHCAALVGAEIAWIEKRDMEAMHLYEEAIRSAAANGFVQHEAVSCELAARFCAARHFDFISRAYLRRARYCYLRWGADGKVKQLEEMHPQLREKERPPGPTDSIETNVEQLDLATVMRTSQALSSEVVLERLIDILMRMAMAQAGAERALLVLARGTAQRIAAEATTSGDTVSVNLRDQPADDASLPGSVLRYVLNTSEMVILDDAAVELPFSMDLYFRQNSARSVLCLPLLNQAKLIGVLYLENNLAPRVFAPARTAVLKLLASQAAISLENARLYCDLAEREARIRRLVDANIIGIVLWDVEGLILEANDAFLCIVGYEREEVVEGRMSWAALTPPEWLDRDERLWLPQLKRTGSLEPFEKEFFRKDGSRVPVLIGVATFEDTKRQGVAFVLDLTERKRAEIEARESERRCHEVQMELAHANRVATMGQLTASIAHEVNQPIAAAVINAEAALFWLDARPPDMEETRQALCRIVKEGNRAGDVVGRIRELVKKGAPRKDRVDVNEVIHEVIELTRGEAMKNGATVQTALGERLPLIEGDRIQLQQVVLNLIVNAVQAMCAVTEGPRELFVTTARAEPSGVLVAVKDSGPGVAPAGLRQLFTPFYTTKPDGLGMGLSICRSIIEAHGGRLWMTGNLPRGAIFHFIVPIQSGHAP
jgi:PAS domain S-box-containing protein